MKAKAKFRKIAEHIHGRRAVYPVAGVRPAYTICVQMADGRYDLCRVRDVIGIPAKVA